MMEGIELVDVRGIGVVVVTTQEVGHNLLSLTLFLTVHPSQEGRYFPFCLRSGDISEPFGNDVVLVSGYNLHLVAALQPVREGHKVVVDLCTEAVAADEGVNGKGKVENACPLR